MQILRASDLATILVIRLYQWYCDGIHADSSDIEILKGFSGAVRAPILRTAVDELTKKKWLEFKAKTIMGGASEGSEYTIKLTDAGREGAETLLQNSDAIATNYWTKGNRIFFEYENTKRYVGLPAVESPLIPASDREVALNHNDPSYKEASEDLDKLVEGIRASNDIPSAPADKDARIAELTAFQRLFRAAKIKVVAITILALPALIWAISQFTGGVLRELAVKLTVYFEKLVID